MVEEQAGGSGNRRFSCFRLMIVAVEAPGHNPAGRAQDLSQHYKVRAGGWGHKWPDCARSQSRKAGSRLVATDTDSPKHKNDLQLWQLQIVLQRRDMWVN